MFSESQVRTGIDLITSAAVKFFLRNAKAQEVEQQRAVYEGERDITNVLTESQLEARRNNKLFVADTGRAEDYAKSKLEMGVGTRLKGAYACYQVGNQLECLRHIMLALDSICCAQGWDKASAFINEQNRVLYNMSEEERKAA